MTKASSAIRDRIVELRRVPAADLIPDPRNWRRHPDSQTKAVRSVLQSVGYADALGSGSTLIACEQLDRRGFGLEIDPRYVDVAVRRWEEFTGRKAERAE